MLRNLNKVFLWICGMVCGMSLVFLLFFVSVAYASYDVDFIFESYEKYDALSRIPVSSEDLEKVTIHLINYLKDEHDDLHINAIINGETSPFYNEREIAHMVDVKNLFLLLYKIMKLLCISACAIFALFLIKKEYLIMLKSMIYSAILFVIAFAYLVFVISKDFTKAFIIFHELLFTNDLWILDYSKDYLLNMVPELFFIDVSIRIATIFTICLALLLIFSIMGIRTVNKSKI